MLKKIPHTYTIIFSIILLCAVLSWIIPAGEYSRHTVEVNGTTRSVIVDNSYHAVESAPQTWQVFSSLLQGFEAGRNHSLFTDYRRGFSDYEQ